MDPEEGETVENPSSQDIDRDALTSAIANLVLEEGALDEIAQLLVRILPAYVKKPYFNKYFSLWEEHGFHLTPVYFAQPIPDTRNLTRDLWDEKPEVVGIDWNEIVQTNFLHNVFPAYQEDYNHFPIEPTDCPYEFHLKNGSFEGTDAMVLYCMVRHFRPNLIIEVGSGFSTRVSAKAALLNGNTRLISIEPYPDAVMAEGFPGLTDLIRKSVQEISLDFFAELNAGDILFIDSTHVVKCGGDVNYLFLEVLPRLKPGVLVHVHDIFLPHEFPRRWMLEDHLFYTEQYLLQAFLAFNSEFEILFANNYMGSKYPEEMKGTFPESQWLGGGSFWMRRKLTH